LFCGRAGFAVTSGKAARLSKKNWAEKEVLKLLLAGHAFNGL
jgi:hypothetical protein